MGALVSLGGEFRVSWGKPNSLGWNLDGVKLKKPLVKLDQLELVVSFTGLKLHGKSESRKESPMWFRSGVLGRR